MSQGALAASKGPDVSLVDLERELEGLLVEYESLSRVWPKEPDVLTRAKIGRRVEDALGQILRLQHAIGTAQAKSIPDAAVHLRRLTALLENRNRLLMRFEAPTEEDDRTMRHLLESALAVVESAGGARGMRTAR